MVSGQSQVMTTDMTPSAYQVFCQARLARLRRFVISSSMDLPMRNPIHTDEQKHLDELEEQAQMLAFRLLILAMQERKNNKPRIRRLLTLAAQAHWRTGRRHQANLLLQVKP